ncbi:MAG: hypothetical protein V3S93_07295 [Methyloceanibacter sp.]
MFLEIALQQFDGDVGVAIPGLLLELVLALPHGAHAALAELGDQLEAVSEQIALAKFAVYACAAAGMGHRRGRARAGLRGGRVFGRRHGLVREDVKVFVAARDERLVRVSGGVDHRGVFVGANDQSGVVTGRRLSFGGVLGRGFHGRGRLTGARRRTFLLGARIEGGSVFFGSEQRLVRAVVVIVRSEHRRIGFVPSRCRSDVPA